MSHTTAPIVPRSHSFCLQHRPCILTLGSKSKESTVQLARWRSRFKGFGFEAIHRFGEHRLVADAMSSLQRALWGEEEVCEEHTDDGSPVYCVSGQISDALKTAQREVPTRLGASATAEFGDAQRTKSFRHYAARLIGTDPRLIFEDQRLVCTKAHVDVALKLIVPNKHWLVVLYDGEISMLVAHLETWRVYDDLKRRFP